MLDALIAMLNRLCPECCPRCGVESFHGFCRECRREFERIESPCPRCAMPSPCSPCLSAGPKWAIDAVRAPYVYAPPLDRYLLALKYHSERHLGRPLGQLLGGSIDGAQNEIDTIVAVPLHPRRLRFRTFNQADEIASALAAHCNLPLRFAGIRRIRQSQPQAELDRRKRLVGPIGCFSVSTDFSDKRVAIVDDVVTTGATVNALAVALKAAGADEVQAWSVARSVGDRKSDYSMLKM